MSKSHISILSPARPFSLYLSYLGPLRMCQTKPMGVMGQFLLRVVIEELGWVKKSQYIFEYRGKSQHVPRSPTVARVLLSKIRSQSATRIVGRKILYYCVHLVDLVGRCRGIRSLRQGLRVVGNMFVDKITRPCNASTLSTCLDVGKSPKS